MTAFRDRTEDSVFVAFLTVSLNICFKLPDCSTHFHDVFVVLNLLFTPFIDANAKCRALVLRKVLIARRTCTIFVLSLAKEKYMYNISVNCTISCYVIYVNE